MGSGAIPSRVSTRGHRESAPRSSPARLLEGVVETHDLTSEPVIEHLSDVKLWDGGSRSVAAVLERDGQAVRSLTILLGLVTAGGLLPIRGWRLTCAPRATLLELVRHKRRGHRQRGRQTGISLHAKEKADHHLPRVTAVVRHIGHEMGTRAVTVRFAVTRMKTLDRKATEQVVRGSLRLTRR